MSAPRMRGLVISAKRLYDDGTADDESYEEIILRKRSDGTLTRVQHREIGDFLAKYAALNLGYEPEKDGPRCDAIDITISETRRA